MLWNSGSVDKKRKELMLVLQKHGVHVALVTETRFSSGVDFNIPEYKVVRSDWALGHSGGVALLVHRSLHVAEVPSVHSQSFEGAFIKLLHPAVFIGVIYNPPQNVLSGADLDTIPGVGNPLVVGGNFNARHNSWKNFINNACGVTLYRHALRSTYRIVAPDDFTSQGSPRQNSSVLDIFLVKDGRRFDASITDDFGTSHRPVLLSPTSEVLHPPDWVRSMDWETYCGFTSKFQLRTSFASEENINHGVQSLSAFLWTCDSKSLASLSLQKTQTTSPRTTVCAPTCGVEEGLGINGSGLDSPTSTSWLGSSPMKLMSGRGGRGMRRGAIDCCP